MGGNKRGTIRKFDVPERCGFGGKKRLILYNRTTKQKRGVKRKSGEERLSVEMAVHQIQKKLV